MNRLVPISVVLLTVLLLAVAPLAAGAQATPTTTVYVVQPGDTVTVITNRYCMTLQELYDLNGAAVSGQLSNGMQIRVVNHCGGQDGGSAAWGNPGGGSWNCGFVYDRGPRVHAMGRLFGSTYVVALGDTSFSIGQRFGISADALARANGINPWRIWAGQRLIIPGAGVPCPQPCPPCGGSYPGSVCPPLPCPVPPIQPIPVTPSPTVQPPPPQPRITITSPTQNQTLPPTFTVTGTGQGFESSIVVRAIDNGGNILAAQTTSLQGANPSTGTPGTFSVQLSVNVLGPTAGFIVAFPPQAPNVQAVSVPVTFSPGGGQGGVTYREYQGNQCQVTTVIGKPYYSSVGGAQVSTFGGAATYSAFMGAKLNGQLWFLIGPIPANNAVVWAPSTSVTNASQGCQW